MGYMFGRDSFRPSPVGSYAFERKARLLGAEAAIEHHLFPSLAWQTEAEVGAAALAAWESDGRALARDDARKGAFVLAFLVTYTEQTHWFGHP